jgi:hypothetical protein
VIPLSWEKWVERYEGRGYRVLTPTYPGFEVGIEALREDLSPIEALTLPAVVEHIGALPFKHAAGVEFRGHPADRAWLT